MGDFQLVAESIVVKTEHGVTEGSTEVTVPEVKEEPEEDEIPRPAIVTVTSIKVEKDENNLLAEDPLQTLESGNPFASEDHAFVSNMVEAGDGQEARDMAVLSQSEDIRTVQPSCGSKKIDKYAEESHFRRDDSSTTSSKDHMTTDLQEHTAETPFKWNLCGTLFSLNYIFSVHVRTDTTEQLFKCNECDKSFAEKCALSRHIKLHTAERPFKCTECSATFSVKRYLTRHVPTHTGKRPFICNVCDLSFARKVHLSQHMLAHTGERPFKCNACDLSFTRRSHLTRHMPTHRGERPFECNECRKSFAEKYTLVRHLQSHNRKRLLKSKKCHTSGS